MTAESRPGPGKVTGFQWNKSAYFQVGLNMTTTMPNTLTVARPAYADNEPVARLNRMGPWYRPSMEQKCPRCGQEWTWFPAREPYMLLCEDCTDLLAHAEGR